MKKIIPIVAIVFLALSCTSLQVTSDSDPTVDFTKFKTLEFYGWADNSNVLLNQFKQARFEKAFAEEFASRGISVVEKGGDIVVSLYVVTQQKTKTTATTVGYGYGYGGYYGYGPGYGWGMGGASTSYHNVDYTVGTMIISVFDPIEEKLIWESIGQGTVQENTRNEERVIIYSVAEIMNKYPVKPFKK